MNIPQIYLVEPYNAYAPKNRKKHPMQVLEEEALMARIVAEAKSATTPPNAPPDSVATAVGMTAGAGGTPILGYYRPRVTVSFLVSTTTASAPATFLFSNASSPELLSDGVATWLWNFGDGTTSTQVSPLHTYTNTGSNFQVTLLGTAVTTQATGSTTQSLNVIPASVLAGFNMSSSFTSSTAGNLSGSAPLTVNFDNVTVSGNAGNTITYLWTFGSGSLTSTTEEPTNVVYTATGSYTVRLSATGSFNITSSQIKTINVYT